MFRNDYVLRVIELGTVALARVLGLRRARRYDEALAEIDRLLRQDWGLNLDFIAQLDAGSLVTLVRGDEANPSLDIGKCVVLADLLQAEGDMRGALGQPGEREDRALKALALLLEVAHAGDETTGQALAPRIETLSNRLADVVFPAELNDRLSEYYDRLGPPANGAP